MYVWDSPILQENHPKIFGMGLTPRPQHSDNVQTKGAFLLLIASLTPCLHDFVIPSLCHS
jgi:hypothetical protein